jgi:hypothetical protein
MSLRLPESVRSVIVLRPDPSGRMISTTLHEPEKKKTKGSRNVRSFERPVVSATKSLRAFADSYLERHDKSNEKKKNGWVRDLPYNLYKADIKGMKKLRVMDNVVRVFM